MKKTLNYIKLPGSRKIRHRASTILTATLTDPSGVWLVQGGELPHTVKTQPQQNTFDYDCDCGHGIDFCSHEIAVMKMLEPDRLVLKRGYR